MSPSCDSLYSEFSHFLDGYAASHAAVAALQEGEVLPTDLIVRTHKYLNNMVEQGYREVKYRVRPRLGFTRFAHTDITITGIALVHQMHQSQFDGTARCSSATRPPQIWDAVLAA